MAEQRELAVARNGVAPTELAAALYGDHGRAVRRSPRLFGFCRSRRPATHRTARDHRTRTAAPPRRLRRIAHSVKRRRAAMESGR